MTENRLVAYVTNSNGLIVPSTEILEAVQCLKEGGSVSVLPVCNDMAPCVRGGVMSLKLTPFNKFSLGMIVLAESNCGLVLHRIMDIDGESIMLMADASTFAQEYCKAEDIIGVGVEMQNILTGRTKRISTAFLWRKLLPFRQYLLRLYDLFHPDQPVPYL